MRRVLASLAAALLAACTVETEGAACRVPGSTDECPGGQACGSDFLCSTRAASCAAAPCTPGQQTCSDSSVMVCRNQQDPVCGAMAVEETCGGLLACASGACVCTRVEVAPSSAPSPLPACTHLSVREAIAQAVGLGLDEVLLVGAPPATYAADAGAVVTVPPGLTLRGDDPAPSAADRVLQVDGLVLSEGSALRGVTLERDGTSASAVGLTAACGPGLGAVSVETVVVRASAGAAFETGVRLEGACPVALDAVGVRGASQAGLLVERSDPAAVLAATGLLLEGNGTGLVLKQGVVTLTNPTVVGSGRDAISVEGGPQAVSLTVDRTEGDASALRGAGVPGSAGVRIACLGASSSVALRGLRVEADPVLGGFETGVLAGGECPVNLASTRVEGALGAGLVVSGTGAVVATGASFSGNAIGVRLLQGSLQAANLTLDGTGSGVEVSAFEPAPATLVLQGGTVRGRGGASTFGVRIDGDARSSVTLDGPVIEPDPSIPAGAFETGILVGGACGVDLKGVTVRGALDAGLRVARAAGASGVAATDLRLEGNGTGLRLEQGHVDLQAPIVASNGGNGIEAQGQSVGLSVADGLIRRNGRAGLWVATPLRFELVRTRLCGNAGARETLSGNPVWAGGMLVIGNPPAGAVVTGNRFDENGGDQVVIYNGGTWNLSATSCDATLPNAFAGYDLSGGRVGLFALGARVNAVFAAWPSAPVLDTDYRVVGASAQVNVGAGTEQCLLDVAPACP